MFEQLRELGVVNADKGIPLSFPVGLSAILTGVEALDHLYAAELEDYAHSGYYRGRIAGGTFNPTWLRALRVRFLCRITSYVVIVCTVDGILKKSYKDFGQQIEQMGYSSILPPNGDDLIKERGEEIIPHAWYRNKVFAHTSYADPQTDSQSLQYSSLDYFSMAFFCAYDSYLGLGGGSHIIDKEENPPELSIVGDRSNIENHYSHWEHMFTDVLPNIT